MCSFWSVWCSTSQRFWWGGWEREEEVGACFWTSLLSPQFRVVPLPAHARLRLARPPRATGPLTPPPTHAMSSKRKSSTTAAAAGAPADADATPRAEIVPLGAGQEVGRSCVVLKYQ